MEDLNHALRRFAKTAALLAAMTGVSLANAICFDPLTTTPPSDAAAPPDHDPAAISWVDRHGVPRLRHGGRLYSFFADEQTGYSRLVDDLGQVVALQPAGAVRPALGEIERLRRRHRISPECGGGSDPGDSIDLGGFGIWRADSPWGSAEFIQYVVFEPTYEQRMRDVVAEIQDCYRRHAACHKERLEFLNPEAQFACGTIGVFFGGAAFGACELAWGGAVLYSAWYCDANLKACLDAAINQRHPPGLNRLLHQREPGEGQIGVGGH